ncbi:unnamed protein product [Sphagnum jensenii]|uniref:GTD-binding domain-containing protein n=1 Tax=Sphagnum jensenii TaxID=128206 RepID=A0ABP1B602_9BRYO
MEVSSNTTRVDDGGGHRHAGFAVQEESGHEIEEKNDLLLKALTVEREAQAALYHELEKERNAAATAANEAMAMITRLQEEKALVQMEARQYQRMVEEKTMYDQEAMEVLKEVIARHEEEKNELEEEIRICKRKLRLLSSCKTQSPVKRAMSSETATSSLQTMISAMGQHDDLWHSFYEDGNTNERTCDDASSSVEGDGNVTPVHQHSQVDEGENKQEEQEARTSYMISGEETTAGKSSDDEVLFEHDVYEVQESCYKLQGIAGEQNRWRHPPNVDRLGKPDHLFIHDEDVRDRNELQYARGDITMPLCKAGNSETNTWLEEFYWIAREGDVGTSSKSRRCHSWTSLEDDVQQLKLRLKALEADRHLIKQTVDSLTRENGQMKLLQEIVEQLRDLRGIERNGLQQQDSFPYALSFQGMMFFPRLLYKVQAKLCKLVETWLRRVVSMIDEGKPNVGWGQLLHTSSIPPVANCITNGCKADINLSTCIQNESVKFGNFSSWPKDVNTRSGTALSGWDY